METPEQRKRRLALVMKNNAKSIARNQQFVLEYLQANPCIDCGESDPVVLDFDHIEGVKDRPISLMIRRNCSLEKIAEEIRKCVVRCANCHRRKTAAERNWFRHGK